MYISFTNNRIYARFSDCQDGVAEGSGLQRRYNVSTATCLPTLQTIVLPSSSGSRHLLDC